MKSIALACLSCLCLLTFQVTGQPAKNEFPLVIEGVKCLVKAYRPTSPMILEPMVNKDSLPKSQVMIAIMLTKSDISSYMSDEEISKVTGAKLDKEQAQKLRSSMKKMYELTGPSVAENPWKGMKHVVDQAFTVESERGKFLVYQLSTQGAKEITGKTTGSIKNVSGTWTIGGEKGDDGQDFKKSMLELVPAEFDKLNGASSIQLVPLEDLLK